MSELKFEIILPYYRRPRMVLNALDSIARQEYDNWHLTFIDDSGDDEFLGTIASYNFGEKLTYVSTMESEDVKRKNGGSNHGHYMNEAIYSTDADVIVILCDDDALMPNYLKDLNKHYTDNDGHMWSYCYLMFYDPINERYEKAFERSFDAKNGLNANKEPIPPSCRVDSSQVTFRTSMFTSKGIKYPPRVTKNLDAWMFSMMHTKYGNCHPNFIVGQVKGFSNDNLGARTGNREFNPIDAKA